MDSGLDIAVLGGGESGVGAALLAKQKGLKVMLSDSGIIKEKYKKVLSHHEIQWEEGQHSQEKLLMAAEVIKSPGIPDDIALIKVMKDIGTPVISEIEFAGRYCQGKKICITGSNGKTTTAMLTYDIFKRAGKDVALVGNVGNGFAMELVAGDHDYWVLELSSFQLDGMFDFKADLAMLLNITPDHLDRYNREMQRYVDSKFRITQNMTNEDTLVFWADDPIISKELKTRDIPAKMIPVTLGEQPEECPEGAWVENEELIIKTNHNTLTMSIRDLALQGKHNLFNSMASGVSSKLFEIRKEHVRESLTNFENIEHRLEFVAKVAGITFINDSKATNVNSTWYALESLEESVIWIAGGVDKGNDYSDLKPLVKDKVKAIICLGVDNKKIHRAFGKIVSQIVDVQSADEAVRTAYALGHKDDFVILSPSCASFDLFENFEDRGHQFKAAVRRL